VPIQPCTCAGGKSGRRWGAHGHCYCGKGASAKAGHQAAAAYAHGYHESDDERRGKEIAHLIRKGWDKKRAAAAAYNMFGESDGEASAASPRFDEKTLRRLLEKCRGQRH
jgi:hypothetical protein